MPASSFTANAEPSHDDLQNHRTVLER